MRNVRKTGLVLCGGGFKGSVHLGVLKVMREHSIPIDVVCGVSVGALNGALVAQGDSHLLEELWLSIEKPSAIFQYWPFYKLPFKRSLCSNQGLRDLIGRYVKPERIRKSSVKFYYATTCLQDGQLRYFDNAFEPIVDGLLASCAMPVFFEPVEIEGRQYVDGGVVCNGPFHKAIEEGCNDIIIVGTSPREIQTVGFVSSRFGLMKRSLQLLIHSRYRAEKEIAGLLVEKIRSQGGL